MSYPGPLSVTHCWAYLPDVAETMVKLVAHDDLVVAALERGAGRRLPASRLPWFAVRAIAPFNETFREMLKMRYLWEIPVLLDNIKLVARRGSEPHTPIEKALQIALRGPGALPQPAYKLAA